MTSLVRRATLALAPDRRRGARCLSRDSRQAVRNHSSLTRLMSKPARMELPGALRTCSGTPLRTQGAHPHGCAAQAQRPLLRRRMSVNWSGISGRREHLPLDLLYASMTYIGIPNAIVPPSPHEKRNGTVVCPVCFLYIPRSTFCLYTEHLDSIFESNFRHFHPLPAVRGDSYGASGSYLRTPRSQPYGALPRDRGAPGDLSRLVP